VRFLSASAPDCPFAQHWLPPLAFALLALACVVPADGTWRYCWRHHRYWPWPAVSLRARCAAGCSHQDDGHTAAEPHRTPDEVLEHLLPFTWLFRSVQRVCRRRPPQNPNIYPMF
jgi:hypothetical protein